MKFIKKILSFFNSLHPIPGSGSGVMGIAISIIVGIFVVLALWNTNIEAPINFRGGKLALVVVYGILSTFITLLFQIVIPTVAFKKVKDEEWTLLKDIGYVLLMIVCIAIGNFLLTLILFPGLEFTFSNFLGILLSTLVIAVPPTVFFLAMSMFRYDKKFKGESEKLVAGEVIPQERNLMFRSQYAEEPVNIRESDFCFAEAEANYVRFYFTQEGVFKNVMLRTTLKDVIDEIGKEEMIIKTHRSYVTNLGKASRFSGNSQGYIVHFEGTDRVARVSRSFTSIVRQLLPKNA